MDLELTGKVAVVKGSTSGIGRATALLLFKEGSKGCVNRRSKISGTNGEAAQVTIKIRNVAV